MSDNGILFANPLNLPKTKYLSSSLTLKTLEISVSSGTNLLPFLFLKATSPLTL
jgi:hypothetical protein